MDEDAEARPSRPQDLFERTCQLGGGDALRRQGRKNSLQGRLVGLHHEMLLRRASAR